MNTNPCAKPAAAAALFGLLLAQAPLGHAATEALGTFSDNGVTNGVIASIPAVPPGAYVVLAKLNLDNNVSANRTVKCTLSAGADFDENTVRLAPSGSANLDTAVVSHQLLVRFGLNPFGNVIHLSCTDNAFGEHVKVKFAKISAIRIDGNLSNRPWR